ncbi:MAG: toxin-antitoxin system YwqK family antitoxin [Deltaproteobacteria bacterium]|nr:toxin-antitoxin system YwqK family antitoxin [Deltaproteobacteria bacterium]
MPKNKIWRRNGTAALALKRLAGPVFSLAGPVFSLAGPVLALALLWPAGASLQADDTRVTRYLPPLIDEEYKEEPEPRKPADPHAMPVPGGPPVLRDQWDEQGRLRGEWYIVLNAEQEVVRHGLYRLYHPNGRTSVAGKYKMGREAGVWRWYNEAGTMLREVYHRGDYEEVTGGLSEDQETVVRSPGGIKLAQGVFKNGKAQGWWRYFYPSGTIKAEGRFLMDTPDGRWSFYFHNGQIQRQEDYRMGILDGRYVKGYDNGHEKVRGTMDNGLRAGEWRTWYLDGQLETVGNYRDDRQEGEWRYYSRQGKLIRREYYVAGRLERELPLPPDEPKHLRVVPNPEGQPSRPVITDEAGNPIREQMEY